MPAGPSASRSGTRQDDERRVRQEHQPAARPEQARRLRDPRVRVRPERRAVFADRAVEAAGLERRGFGVAEVEREVDAELPLEPASGLELRWRVVDPDRAGAALREPRRDVRRPAAELDDVLPGDVVRQQVDVRFGDAPDAPRDLVGRPAPPTRLDVLVRVAIPGLAIRADVLGQLLRVGHGVDGTSREVVRRVVPRHSAGRRGTPAL